MLGLDFGLMGWVGLDDLDLLLGGSTHSHT